MKKESLWNTYFFFIKNMPEHQKKVIQAVNPKLLEHRGHVFKGNEIDAALAEISRILAIHFPVHSI